MDPSLIPVYCLSERKHEQQWPVITQMWRSQGFPNVEMVEGVIGATIPDEELRRDLSVGAYATLKSKERVCHADLSGPGSVGCAKGHYNMLALFLQTGKPFAIISERDAVLHGNFREAYTAAMGDLSRSTELSAFHVAYLGCWKHIGDTRSDTASNYWHSVPTGQPVMGTHAYVITRAAAEMITSRFFPIEMQVDWFMSRLAFQGLRRISLRQSIVSQRLSLSDVTIHSATVPLVSLQQIKINDPQDILAAVYHSCFPPTR